MIRKLTVKEFLEMNDIEWNDIKEFGDARIGATEGIDEEMELTIYTDEDTAQGEGWVVVCRNDNKWNDSIEVISGLKGNWNI